MDSGEKRLQELGYKQELKRSLSVVSNFALSFAIISILTGVTTTYNTGLTYGGPVAIFYGWIIVSFFTICVAFSMAEICSAFPTSGGLYFWSYNLAGKNWGPFAAWITGWFNILGQWATTTSANFSLATLVQVIILLSTGGSDGGYYASKYLVIALHGIFLVVHGLLNSLEIKWVSRLGTFAAFLNLIGVFFITVLVLSVSPTRQSAKFVLTHFYEDEEDTGIHSRIYTFLLGLLMSQYSLIGYDCSAHMSEETKAADKNGAYGIIVAVTASVAVGLVYLFGITFIISDVSHVLDKNNDARGYAAAQAFYDAFKNRYGNGAGGIVCLGIIATAVFLCSMSSVTSNSRMTYAFSRDGALPFSKTWHKVNKQDVPTNAVWLAVVVAFCMALPYLGSTVAFQAMVSIATIGSCISYALPIFFRITIGSYQFRSGPFSLGRYSFIVGWMAVGWTFIITLLFCLPTVYPVTIQTFNYTPVAISGVLLWVVFYWSFSAKYWFKGPISNIEAV